MIPHTHINLSLCLPILACILMVIMGLVCCREERHRGLGAGMVLFVLAWLSILVITTPAQTIVVKDRAVGAREVMPAMIKVYGNSSGSEYHLLHCRYLDKTKPYLSFPSEETGINAGRHRCVECFGN